MIGAAIVGLGRWGRNLIECTQGKTDKLRFAAGVARSLDTTSMLLRFKPRTVAQPGSVSEKAGQGE